MPALAQTDGDKAGPAPIRIVVDDAYPPYSFRNADGRLQGVVRDRWELWSKRTGIPVEITGMDWGRAQQVIASGEADVIDTLFETEARTHQFLFSPAYARIEVPIFFNRNVGGVTDAESLRDFQVGVKEGDACVEWLHKNGVLNIRAYPSYPAVIDGAQAGEIPMFCMDLPPATYYLFKKKLQDSFKQTKPFYHGEFHWALPRAKEALFSRIMAGYRQIPERELRAIDERWLGSASAFGPAGDFLAYFGYGAAGVLAMLLILVVWNRTLQRRVSAKTAEALSAQDALRRSERNFRELVDATPAGVFETDIDDRIVYANDRWREITGRAFDTRSGRAIADVLHPDDRAAFMTEWIVTTRSRQPFRREHRIMRTDGSDVWVLTHATLLVGSDGEGIGHIGSIVDISERKAAEMALIESEQRFRSLYREAPLPYQSLSIPDQQLLDVNEAWLETFGYQRHEVIGRWIGDFIPETGLESYEKAFNAFLAAGTLAGYTVEVTAKSGEKRLMTINGRIARTPQGEPWQSQCILTDVTERTRMENTLRVLTMAVQQSPMAVVVTDVDGVIEYVNPTFTATTGYSYEEAIGNRPSIIKGGETSPEEYQALWKRITNGEPWHGTFYNRRKNGTFYWEDAVIAPVRDAGGAITHFIGIKQDITARREAEARVAFLAHHDSLTKLPNRLLGKDRMEWAMAHAERSRSKAALILLDLDHFKRVNDSLGHSVGDALLREVAERLRDCVRETDTISRQGGDEFLIVLSDIDDPEAIARVATKIMRKLAPSFFIAEHELATTLSMGIAVYPDDGPDYDSLLKRADTAMYHAKESGRNTYRFFTEQMNIDANEYLSIRGSLTRAIEREEFELYYQPQVSLNTGRVTGVEALIRWHHPEHGMMPPNRFIPVAEESGLIVPIGDWVLRKACAQAMEWRRQGVPRMVVAVNLSGVQFKRGDLYRSVTSALAASGLEPEYLELELTESILVKDTANVLSTVEQLKALGIQLSIDDFGTGYSSFAYLKKFHVDKIKIDQSFVRDITSDANDDAIVRAIVQMARSLGLRTIAEGVENGETLAALRQHQCDEVQGYLFARPMAPDQLPGVLSTLFEISPGN